MKAVKITIFLLTLIANITFAVVVFAAMIIAMNGFSESDATYGLAGYGVLAVIVGLTCSAIAVLLATRLLKRELGPFAAGAIAVVALSVVGVALNVVCGIIGVAIAEFVRVKF